jgi:hypothetical protein
MAEDALDSALDCIAIGNFLQLGQVNVTKELKHACNKAVLPAQRKNYLRFEALHLHRSIIENGKVYQ